MEPRIRVSAILRWQGRLLLCRQEKPGKQYWLLPGGGVEAGETLMEALRVSCARSSASRRPRTSRGR
jgi:ADP-ribose pyrophosphatase